MLRVVSSIFSGGRTAAHATTNVPRTTTNTLLSPPLKLSMWTPTTRSIASLTHAPIRKVFTTSVLRLASPVHHLTIPQHHQQSTTSTTQIRTYFPITIKPLSQTQPKTILVSSSAPRTIRHSYTTNSNQNQPRSTQPSPFRQKLSLLNRIPSSISSIRHLIRRQFGSPVGPPTVPPSIGHLTSPDDVPPQLFDASHLLAGIHEDKKERLRCLEVDDNGNYRHVEFSRGELSTMLELHPRDLRFLDSSMRNLPSILARKRVIIVNLEMFKALITADRVLMFDPWYPHVQSVVQPLQAAVLNGGELFEGKPVPFEFIALEHILLTVSRNLEERFDLYNNSLEPLLASSSHGESSSNLPTSTATSPYFNTFVTDGSGETLMHLLQLKNALTSFEMTLRETGNALRDLLDTDEDMAEMYLTHKKQTGHAPRASEHGDIEVILEASFRQVDELENEVEQNVKTITLTEEQTQIWLDSNRNRMMELELVCSISTLGVTTAALGAGLFGMNLPNSLDGNPYSFWFVGGLFILLSIGVIRKLFRLCSRYGIHLLKKPQKPPPPLPPTLRGRPQNKRDPRLKKKGESELLKE